MSRPAEVYGNWVDHPDHEPAWTSGSGYLLAARLLLTAAHVVCPSGAPVADVRVRALSGELAAAQVVWHRHEGEVDVALVEITDPAWMEPRWRQPVRWGRFVTRRAGQRCEAIGFPSVVATPQRRDSHHAEGRINPGSLVKAGLHAVEVDNPPVPPADGRSWWSGMSGAAVLVDGLLVAVVTKDPAGFDSRRLVTVPVTQVLDDPEFAGIVERHAGRAPTVEPVELGALGERIKPVTSPAGLLRADVAETLFRPRPEFDQLVDWCHSDTWSSTRLVVGPGGQGKTRVAYHLAHAMSREGWATVVLAERATRDQIAGLVDVRVPVLVVVDYAESRADQLDAVLDALGRAETTTRLLLLARTAGAWRTERVGTSQLVADLADDRIVVSLSPVEDTSTGRAAAWREAVTALAHRLADLDDLKRSDHGIGVTEQPAAWPSLADSLPTPALDDPRYRTILAVQMDALGRLLDAAQPTIGETGTPEQLLLRHERSYGERLAYRFGVALDPAMLECLVAAATLWGAATADDARALLNAALPGPDRDDLRTRVDAWLHALYSDRQWHWAGCQPDRLAEHLVGSVFSPPVRCPALLAATYSAASPDQWEQAITVLGRAAAFHPALSDTLVSALSTADVAAGIAALRVATRLELPQPLLAAVDAVVGEADLPTLRGLYAALPRSSLVLALTSVRVARALVTRWRILADDDRDAYLPDLAQSVNNLAIRLAEAGHRAEGLTAAQEAVDLYRELATVNRDAYLPDLAMSVNTLANRLGEAGHRAEGLTAAQEAVDLYRELATVNRDAYLPDLAMSVNNLAIRLAETGHRAEGLTAAQEAVDLRRKLATVNRDAYLPDLASSVYNLANRLGDTGHRAEGLAAAQEAVDLRRELATVNRDAYLPDLAMSVNNLGIRLAEAGHRAEGLAAAQEAVDHFRELAVLNRDAYLPDLASSVNNLAIDLTEAGHRAEGLAAAQEAVDHYLELTAAEPEYFADAASHAVAVLDWIKSPLNDPNP